MAAVPQLADFDFERIGRPASGSWTALRARRPSRRSRAPSRPTRLARGVLIDPVSPDGPDLGLAREKMCAAVRSAG